MLLLLKRLDVLDSCREDGSLGQLWYDLTSVVQELSKLLDLLCDAQAPFLLARVAFRSVLGCPVSASPAASWGVHAHRRVMCVHSTTRSVDSIGSG